MEGFAGIIGSASKQAGKDIFIVFGKKNVIGLTRSFAVLTILMCWEIDEWTKAESHRIVP